MNLSENDIIQYNLIRDEYEAKLKVINKTVNRGYTCEKSGTTTVFHPREFALSPVTSGEKILWGGYENLDGTSQSAKTLVNSEDYNQFEASAYTVDDTLIFVGNISGQTQAQKCRVPFYTNGYSDGKFVTNVSAATLTGNYTAMTNGYVFAASNLITACSAWTVMFPNGYVANCVSNGSRNRLSCYTFTDEYSLDIMSKSRINNEPLSANCKDYIKRASIFPSVSYETYVSPFYSEMSMAYIDNSETIDITTGLSLTDYNYQQSITVDEDTTPVEVDYACPINFILTNTGGTNNVYRVNIQLGSQFPTPQQLYNSTGLTLELFDNNTSISSYTIQTASSTSWRNIVQQHVAISTGQSITKAVLKNGSTSSTLTVSWTTPSDTNDSIDEWLNFTLRGTGYTNSIISSSTSSQMSNYGVWAIVNNKIGADKYKFDFSYEIYSGETMESTASTTLTISGSVKSIYSALSITGKSIRNVKFISYKINGQVTTILRPPKIPVNVGLWAVYGKVMGGITDNNKHKLSMNGLVPGSIFDERIEVSVQAKTLGNRDNPQVYQDRIGLSKFEYQIDEGISNPPYSASIQDYYTISDSQYFSVFPTIRFEGIANSDNIKLYTDKDSGCEFYRVQSGNTDSGITYFKLSGTTYYYPTSSSTIPPTITQTRGWSSITASITSDNGYSEYAPSKDYFIVGVYEVKDPNDISASESDRRVKTRLIKVYRNYEFEYIGT